MSNSKTSYDSYLQISDDEKKCKDQSEISFYFVKRIKSSILQWEISRDISTLVNLRLKLRNHCISVRIWCVYIWIVYPSRKNNSLKLLDFLIWLKFQSYQDFQNGFPSGLKNTVNLEVNPKKSPILSDDLDGDMSK